MTGKQKNFEEDNLFVAKNNVLLYLEKFLCGELSIK